MSKYIKKIFKIILKNLIVMDYYLVLQLKKIYLNMSYTIKHLFHIKSPIDDVFDALTDIKKLQKWYTTETSGESKLNGNINFKFGEIDFKIQITEYEKNKKITWECVDTSLEALIGQKYTYELDENADKTRVRYSQSAFEDQDDFYANMNYSIGKYLESLRQFCQSGVSEGFGSDGYRS